MYALYFNTISECTIYICYVGGNSSRELMLSCYDKPTVNKAYFDFDFDFDRLVYMLKTLWKQTNVKLDL